MVIIGEAFVFVEIVTQFEINPSMGGRNSCIQLTVKFAELENAPITGIDYFRFLAHLCIYAPRLLEYNFSRSES